MLPTSSVLKAPSWMPPPPEEFFPLPTHRRRNYCRIWESPEPLTVSQNSDNLVQRSSGIMQMDVDPKEVSIASVLQSRGDPISTLRSGSSPSSTRNMSDQGSGSPTSIRGQRERTGPEYFVHRSSGDEQSISKETLSGQTGENQAQTRKLTHIGYLNNADPQPSTTRSVQGDLSTHIEKGNNLNPLNAPTHYSNKPDYTFAICNIAERKPSVTDLTEDAGSDMEDLMEVRSCKVDAVQVDLMSTSTVINEEEKELNLDLNVTRRKHPTRRRTSTRTRSKSSKPKPRTKTKPSEGKSAAISDPVVEGDSKYFCSICQYTLNRSSDYRRHSMSNKHREACNAPKITYNCPFCSETLCRLDALKRHLRRSCPQRYSKTDTSPSTNTTPVPTPI